MPRKCTEENINALKTAFKLVLADVGGLVAASTCTRVEVSQLSAYGNVANREKIVPVDVALDLEMIGGAPHVTAALAAAQGYELVPLDSRPTHELVSCMSEISLDSGRLLADAVQLMNQAHDRRSIEAVERVQRDLRELISAAREAQRALSAVMVMA